MTENPDGFPASAAAAKTFEEAAADDFEKLAALMELVAARSTALTEPMRIRQKTVEFLNGTVDFMTTRARDTRREAEEIRAWLSGKPLVRPTVTHSSDGNGAPLGKQVGGEA